MDIAIIWILCLKICREAPPLYTRVLLEGSARSFGYKKNPAPWWNDCLVSQVKKEDACGNQLNSRQQGFFRQMAHTTSSCWKLHKRKAHCATKSHTYLNGSSPYKTKQPYWKQIIFLTYILLPTIFWIWRRSKVSLI